MPWLALAPLLLALHLVCVNVWVALGNPFDGRAPARAQVERWLADANPFADSRPVDIERKVARMVGQRQVYCTGRGPMFSGPELDCAPGDRLREMNAGLNCPLYRVTIEGGGVRVKPIGSGRLRPDRIAIAEKWQRAWRRRENRRLRQSRSGDIPVRLGPKLRFLAAPWQVSGLCRRLRAA